MRADAIIINKGSWFIKHVKDRSIRKKNMRFSRPHILELINELIQFMKVFDFINFYVV